MTLCFRYRIAPTLALLASAACLLPGCVDPKSIGQEPGSTDSDSEGSGDTGSEGATEGMTSQTSGQSSGPSGTDTDPGPGCPPIDPAPCSECECVGESWSCTNVCVESCAGATCGEACSICPDDDPECEDPAAEGVCTADGHCVGTPPPKLGFCEGQLQPGFENELDAVSGCADLNVYAHDPSDQRGLAVWIDQGLVAAAVDSGEPVHAELSATDPAVDLEGRAGFNVTEAECNDAIGPGIDIKESWRPSAGTVIVDVIPTGDGFATATVELVDVELARVQPGPAPIVVNMTFSNVGVGWLPG